MSLPEGDKHSHNRREILDMLAVFMAGRIGEEAFSNDLSSGAASDIQMATHLARKMVCEWGMSRLGMIHFGEQSDLDFLGRDLGRHREYSEKTAEAIDEEVKHVIDEAFGTAREIIDSHRRELEAIARALLEYETLDAQQIRELINTGTLSNPPVRPVAQPPPAPALAGEGKKGGKSANSKADLSGLESVPSGA